MMSFTRIVLAKKYAPCAEGDGHVQAIYLFCQTTTEKKPSPLEPKK
jgi:hypothetical protein